uniref:Uncharacterized protein n=1 Tax=Glossina morsitans morsitans TaxID=37546 RepID=A0A1B0FBL1_GLOMM
MNNYCVAVNKTLPYLVSNVDELLDMESPEDEDDGPALVLDNQRKGKYAVIKISTRQAYFLPVIGLVDADKLKRGDLDSYLILETLPVEYDARVKAMEVDERPTEQYSDIGGLDKQIQELIEAIVLPMTHKDKFKILGIQSLKGGLFNRENKVVQRFHDRKEDLIRAFYYWKRAAAQGYSAAQVKLGDNYYYGWGTNVDFETAAALYCKASE